jgi:hypothetical protein
MLRSAHLLHIERMGGSSLGAAAGLYRCSLNTEMCEADYKSVLILVSHSHHLA